MLALTSWTTLSKCFSTLLPETSSTQGLPIFQVAQYKQLFYGPFYIPTSQMTDQQHCLTFWYGLDSEFSIPIMETQG
jgi:hypothetical protein